MTVSTETANTTAAEANVPQPSRCVARIEEVRTRWWALRRCLAVSVLAACVATSGGLAIVIDSQIRGGHLARFVLLLACIALVAWVTRRFVIPLWDRLSSDQAALLLERGYPELTGRLITAVQLASPSQRSFGGTSAGLYEQVCTAAEHTAGGLKPANVLPSKQTLQRSAVAWVLIIALAAIVGFRPGPASIGIMRLLLPWSDVRWPQHTRIEITDPAPGEPIRVVRGGTLTLVGQVDGEIPTTGVLRVQAGSGAADRAYFDISADGGFVVRYRPINVDLEVSIEIGDADPVRLDVVMVPPPEITGIETECVYPPYTQLPPQHYPDGNIQAVFGSEIRLMVGVSKPLDAATLAWTDDGTSVAMHGAGAEEWTVRFPVTESKSYRIHLTDTLGFHNADPVMYHVEMIDNQYPRLSDVTPTADKRVTPTAVLPITAKISDDFGVTDVILSYRVGKDEEARQVTIPLDRPGKRVELAYEWSLEALKLKADQTVTYRLEVRDAGEHAEQQDWPVSRWRRLHVMTEPELARLLMEQLEQIMDQLAQLADLQSECADSVTRIAHSVAVKPDDSGKTARKRTQSEKWRQDWLARRAGQLANRLSGVADDYAISRIGQASRRKRLRETADGLARLSGADMPGVVVALSEALSVLRGESPTTQPGEDR